MRRGFVIFPSAGSRLSPGLHVSWAGKYLRASGKGWCARESLAHAGTDLSGVGDTSARVGETNARVGKDFRAREGFVSKEPGNVPSCLRFVEIKQQRSANSGPHGSGQGLMV